MAEVATDIPFRRGAPIKPCGKHGKQAAMGRSFCCVLQKRFTVGGPAAMVDPSRRFGKRARAACRLAVVPELDAAGR
jgi:hypothetical protein